MSSSKTAERVLAEQIRRAWATLGLPLAGPLIDERSSGIIDPEALTLLTLDCIPEGRHAVDVAAWLVAHADLVNHQKLKALYRSLPLPHQRTVAAAIERGPYQGVSALAGLAGTSNPVRDDVRKVVKAREGKLVPMTEIASRARMLGNRLLFGTGIRADVVSLLQTRIEERNGVTLARLLCVAKSTISRILTDLRTCRFLDPKNMPPDGSVFPPPFVSALTVANGARWLDASRFESQLLAKEELVDLDVANDGLMRLVIAAMEWR